MNKQTEATIIVGDTTYRYSSLEAFGATGGAFARRTLIASLQAAERRGVVPEGSAARALGAGVGEGCVFAPSRVLLQDFTGVPSVVDLAGIRSAVAARGGDPASVEPKVRVDLVVDHSVQVDAYGRADALSVNMAIEMERNRERYALLRWAEEAFSRLNVVAPGRGIVHQVHLESLADVVSVSDAGDGGAPWLEVDTVVGTDSHTTMVNALGVLGWGVGGIDAEAVMMGASLPIAMPEIVGVELRGRLGSGATATDAVLAVVERLRQEGVVGAIVEFFGAGLDGLTLPERATIANMAPEYGATAGFFPIDDETLRYLSMTGRSNQHVDRVRAFARAQGLFREAGAGSPGGFDRAISFDLAKVEPVLAGPKRPQDKIGLGGFAKAAWETIAPRRDVAPAGPLKDGDVVVAAITSCTNTSNPAVMIAAGLLARAARARGLTVPAHVKTSLAPGSRATTRYLEAAGLMDDLEALGFHVVGYGCTTCIGNTGPLPEAIEAQIDAGDLTVCSVLSGNRNFEGRIHAQIKANYLASPPLVVAYALAGTMNIDLTTEPVGIDASGAPVMLEALWPDRARIDAVALEAVTPEVFEARASSREAWESIPAAGGALYGFAPDSTYIAAAPFFEDARPARSIEGGRALVVLGDSITTDHISPAGMITPSSEAGRYLGALGVARAGLHTYGARRGNHEVMARGTFANPRLRNKLVAQAGPRTLHHPSGEVVSIFEACARYRAEQTPLVVLAGAAYGTGSSRDWAAKGPALLGVRVVIAESFERIHRANLIGMGIMPLVFKDGESVEALGLRGDERFAVELPPALEPGAEVEVVATSERDEVRFTVWARVETVQELAYLERGGILPHLVHQWNAA